MRTTEGEGERRKLSNGRRGKHDDPTQSHGRVKAAWWRGADTGRRAQRQRCAVAREHADRAAARAAVRRWTGRAEGVTGQVRRRERRAQVGEHGEG